MAKSAPIQNNFSSGEVSPLMYGRVDFTKYKSGLKTCLNHIPLVQGCVTRRPGTMYAGATKFTNKATRLVRFEFSTTQAYILEFGDQYMRVWKDHAQVVNVQAVSNAVDNGSGLIRLTVADASGLYTGNTMTVSGVVGTTEANGVQTVNNVNVVSNISGTANNGDGRIRLTVASTANMNAERPVVIAAVAGTVEANGTWPFSIVDATHIDITGPLYTNVYSAGGTATAVDTTKVDLQGTAFVNAYASGGSTSTIVEIPTSYLEADLFDLKFAQSADTLYVAHSSYAPQSIARSSHTNWAITELFFTDGPYMPVNTTATTLVNTSANTVGSGYTITASSTTGVNGGLGFQATDVGRLIRMPNPAGTAWGWAKITSVTSATAVVVTQYTAMSNGGTAWRLGAWSDTTGYPADVTFYQDRLGWAGQPLEQLNFSCTSDYLNHGPTTVGFTTIPAVSSNSSALAFTLNSSDVQAIKWMLGDAQGLLVGTASGEWVVTPSTLNEALTSTNISAKQMTSYGSQGLPAVRVGYTSLFLTRSARKLRELAFVYYENRYHAPDMTAVSEHITYSGIKSIAFQQEIQGILWACRNDGVLLGFDYERDQEILGWSRHILGGQSQSGDPIVESVAVIPAPDLSRDELWMVVQRYINGATVRCIEYMTKPWARGDTLSAAVFSDCSLSYSGTPVSSVTAAHLANETLQVFADGLSQGLKTADTNGTVALSPPASVVTVGYAYNSDGETLRNDSGASDGTAQGKTQRTHRVFFRVHETLGLMVGPDFDHLTLRDDRNAGDTMSAPPALLSGDHSDVFDGDYSMDNTIAWRFSGPYPGTVLAIGPQQFTFDR